MVQLTWHRGATAMLALVTLMTRVPEIWSLVPPRPSRTRSSRVSPSPVDAPTTSTLRNGNIISPKPDRNDIDWHMQRDACDDWLEEVLLPRKRSATLVDEESHKFVFDTASWVVEEFVSGKAATSPVLRRVVNLDSDIRPRSEVMFSPLFGTTCHADTSLSLSDSTSLAPNKTNPTPKKNGRKRTNLKITVAYRGGDFCGWQDQRHQRGNPKQGTAGDGDAEEGLPPAQHPGVPSVQGTLADILEPALAEPADGEAAQGDNGTTTRRAGRQGSQQRTARAGRWSDIKVAGRTDRGVSALGQVCRVRTWREIAGVETYVRDLVNGDARTREGGVGLRIRNVEKVGDDFHPSFGTAWRSYAYLIDVTAEDDPGQSEQGAGSAAAAGRDSHPRISRRLVPRLDRMLRALEGRELDYVAFSHGKVKTETTLCTLYHARAGVVEWRRDDSTVAVSGRPPPRQAVCFELAGNRFLRRMIRILVATALREAHRCGESDDGGDALLQLLSTKDRRCRSRAAPPDGLLFVRAE